MPKPGPLPICFGISILFHVVLLGALEISGFIASRPALQQDNELATLTLVAAPDEPAAPTPVVKVVAPAIIRSLPVENFAPAEPVKQPAPPEPKPIIPVPQTVQAVVVPPALQTKFQGDASSPQPGMDATTPIHVYAAELMYQSPGGFYAGPDVQCNLTRYPVDQANTLYAGAYALLGFKIGYATDWGKSRFSVFVEAKNLTDENYAASVDPTGDADASSQLFHPGDGRSFYGGVTWTW